MDAPVTTLFDLLPAIYRGFLPSFFQSEVPRERLADCAHCPMLAAPKGGAGPAGEAFLPETKCCTFHPTMPNYLVGVLLEDPDPSNVEGQRRVAAKIAGRVGVTPLGIYPPKTYLVLFRAGRRLAFGKARALRCPYYEPGNGRCTIWPARSDACSTYFCRSVAGAAGDAFWELFQRYLEAAQRALAVYALHRLGICADPLLTEAGRREELRPEDLDETVPDEQYAAWWGSWAGRETDLYRACARLVAGLGQAEYAKLRTTDEVPISELERALARMKLPQVPGLLVLSPDLCIEPIGSGHYGLGTGTARFEVSELVLAVLRLFDGRTPTAEVVRKGRALLSVNLDESYVAALRRRGVLVEPRPTLAHTCHTRSSCPCPSL